MSLDLQSNSVLCKICTFCCVTKTISEFQDNGKWAYCKQCNKERSLRYYHANKERLNQKVECKFCKKTMSRTGYYNHIKTQKHRLAST
jgi:hypothetical protein